MPLQSIILQYPCAASAETPDGLETLEHTFTAGSDPASVWAAFEEKKRAAKAAHPLVLPPTGFSSISLQYPCAVSGETPQGIAQLEHEMPPGTDPAGPDAWPAFEEKKRAIKAAHPLVT